MKGEIKVIFLVFVLVGMLSFFIYNFNGVNLTGLVIVNDSFSLDEIEDVNVSEDMVLDAFSKAEEIIVEMIENNFSTLYMEDVLAEARRVFGQVKFAEILRNPDLTYKEQTEARSALRLVDWKEISYNDVLVYINEIEDREHRAFIIYDDLTYVKIRLEEIRDYVNATEIQKLIDNADTAFYEDRYDEADDLLIEIRDEIEKEGLHALTLKTLSAGIWSFIKRNWLMLLVLFILLGVGGFFGYKKLKRHLLEKKIKKMTVEKGILIGLIKKAQIERFKKNKLSGLVYNVRMKKYKERLHKIKQELPVLEQNLWRIKHKGEKK